MTTSNPIPSDPSRSRAVVIGVDQYPGSGLRSYRPLAQGARAIAALFRDPAVWGLSEDHCTVLTGPANTDETAILDAIDRAASEADDTLVVYFAGHGVTWEGQYYLAHSRARPGDCGRWLSWNRLRSRLDDSRTRAQTRIVILDACESADAIDQGTPHGDAALLASCSGTERAWVAPASRYPTYTGALISVLSEGAADLGGLLTPTDVHRAVRLRLVDSNQSPDFLPRREGGTRPWLRNRAVPAAATGASLNGAKSKDTKGISSTSSQEQSRSSQRNAATSAYAALRPPQQDDLDNRSVHLRMLSIIGIGAIAILIMTMSILASGRDDTDPESDGGSSSLNTDGYDPALTDQPYEATTSASPAPRNDPLTEAVVGDCLDDSDWTVDGLDLSFEDSCGDDAFEVVEVIEGSTDVEACSATGHGFSAVASESTERVLCLQYIYGDGDAAYAERGECVAGSSEYWPSDWVIDDCEIDTLEVVEVIENDGDTAACDDHWGLSAGYLISALHDGLDVVLCVRLVLPQGDLGHAVYEDCLTKTGTGADVQFEFSDCDSADVFVTGRVNAVNEYEACGDNGWLSWQSSAFPDVAWTVCYRDL